MMRPSAYAGVISMLLLAVLSAGCSGTPGAETPQPPVAPAPEATSAPRSLSITPGTTPTATAVPEASADPTITFAVIGDFGTDDSHEAAVAKLVDSWDPAFIITTGDDYYRVAGGAGTGRYDEAVGAYYGRWLADIRTTGTRERTGEASRNAFFPSMGNHDYSDAKPSPGTYTTYFRLPGEGFASSSDNERYYDFVYGPVHFFAINSNPDEPDGIKRDSKQARWLQRGLAESDSAWNVVYNHHPPYSSGRTHGSMRLLQWPYAAWGADAVLSGHDHTYERIERDGMVYFVNGLGGASRYRFAETVRGSRARFDDNWGAQKVSVSSRAIRFDFYDVTGKRQDRYQDVASP